MTEDEAKTKRCPVGAGQFVTVQGPSGPVAGARIFGASCIGSACMAWRWGGPHSPPSIEAINEERAGGSPLDAVKALNLKNPPGFCGLAGAVSP